MTRPPRLRLTADWGVTSSYRFMSLTGTGYYSLYIQCDTGLCPLRVPVITGYTHRFYGRYTVVRRAQGPHQQTCLGCLFSHLLLSFYVIHHGSGLSPGSLITLPRSHQPTPLGTGVALGCTRTCNDSTCCRCSTNDLGSHIPDDLPVLDDLLSIERAVHTLTLSL